MTDVELVQSQLKALQERQEELMRIPRIKKYLGVVSKHVQENQGREMTVYEKRNVAQCLYNAVIDTGLKAGTKLFEATTEDNIAFLGVQLPVIAALLPSLALSEISVVQAMDRRIAAVFYLDVRYGSTKGAVTAGETMIGAKSGHDERKSGRRYAMARVVDEPLTNIANSEVDIGEVLWHPGLIHLENVKVSFGGTILFTANENGILTDSDDEIVGWIHEDGTYSIDFSGTALTSGQDATITYDYQYDLVDSDCDCGAGGVPEVDVRVSQETVEAIDFPLRAKYSIGAQIDMMKAHGVDLESELVKYLGSEVKFTIDQVGLDMIDDAAKPTNVAADGVTRLSANPITTWDARPSVGEPWINTQVPSYSNVCRKAA